MSASTKSAKRRRPVRVRTPARTVRSRHKQKTTSQSATQAVDKPSQRRRPTKGRSPVRKNKVARAKKLISDPNYPSVKVLNIVARRLAKDLNDPQTDSE